LKEITLLDMVDRIGRGEEWRGIEGIAYRSASEIVSNCLRKLVDDLDSFPYPEREFTPMSALGHSIVPLLASRGCARTCSFCSIQTFYRAAPGKIVRTRNPAKVVEEMSALHHDRGTAIFLFQDDDFPLFGPIWRRWAAEFVNELHRAELPGKIIWKMNCRADAVDRDVFVSMRNAGLYFVYMGLESGNEEGLRTLHKQITVEQNLQAVQILKSIGLVFEYGFMLFDPSSTFDSVRVNLDFLRQIVGDGTTAATFCRMLPYDGTAIKDDLERTGRLRGDVCHPDYDFLDPKLNEFYESLTKYLNITGWIHSLESLTNHLKCAWHEVAVIERLFPPLEGFLSYRRTLQGITASSNNFLLQVVEDLSLNFSHGTQNLCDEAEVEAIRLQFLREMLNERNSFVERNQVALLQCMPQTRSTKAAVSA
jgi:anaerobic magnesium-protoporphyrin IX monomethyl ester cyclase